MRSTNALFTNLPDVILFSNHIHGEEVFELVADALIDRRKLADGSLGISFKCERAESEFDVVEICCSFQDNMLVFRCRPTVFTVKIAFLKLLSKLDTEDAVSLVLQTSTLNQKINQELAIRTLACLSFLKNILSDHLQREKLSLLMFDMSYAHLISRISLLYDVLLRRMPMPTMSPLLVPKWKGRAMQFIELISIGIELELFEGSNQNEICNSLIKAFQVEAESDEPIYKQRFDALFRRSKSHLPLVHAFIAKVEKAKSIKVVLAPE